MERSYKLEELNSVVQELISDIKNSGNVIGFSGNLGAGKTTFTKELLKVLGGEGNVVSPTFVLRRDYLLGPTPALPVREGEVHKVIHIDAYRLEQPEHIYQVISKEELEDKNNLIIIEWPEKVLPLTPGGKGFFDTIYLFEHVDENTRKISRE
jgi:tRNA threonylcarbamoyladenosine biosynthesis protein TsaE